MKYKITEIDIKNYDELIKLWENDKGLGTGAADSKENLTNFLDRNDGLNFNALDGNRIIGTILCGNDGRRGYLYHLYVLPEFRRKGIGTDLVRKCLNKLLDEKIMKCHIMFFNHNTGGKLFWEKTGFTFRDDVGVMSMNL